MTAPTDGVPSQHLAVPAELVRLAEIRAFVRRQMAGLGADDETTADLVQAVDELVSNVIEHGYQGAAGAVEIDLAGADGTATIRIRDGAPPFDPTTVPTPPLDLPLERRPLGGMGVHLARTLTDGMDHRILPSGGNELTIRKALPDRPRSEEPDGHHDHPTDA